MDLYVDNSSYGFTRKAYERVKENTGKSIFRAVIISKDSLRSGSYKLFRKKKIADIELIIYGTAHLKKAIKLHKRKKRPVSLTAVVSKALTEKEKALLSTVRREIKIIDTTAEKGNLDYYESNKYVLYKWQDKDTILDTDIMHIYKMGETQYQCRHSACLGKTLYVTREGNVHFCPYHAEESIVGTLNEEKNYFHDERIVKVLQSAIEKRKACKEKCEYYEDCSGACPLESGCGNFPELFDKNSEFIDSVTEAQDDLSEHNYAVAKLVIKDIVYGE